jgi:hypothetical protein
MQNNTISIISDNNNIVIAFPAVNNNKNNKYPDG